MLIKYLFKKITRIRDQFVLSICIGLIGILGQHCNQLDTGCVNADISCSIPAMYLAYTLIETRGHGMAAWVINNDVYARYYSRSTGWQSVIIIDNLTTAPSALDVAITKGGRAVVVWVQNDGSFDSIYAARFSPASGWSEAQQIDNQSVAASNPAAGMAIGGNAVVVWKHGNDIYETRYSSSQWSTPSLMVNFPSSTTPLGLSVGEAGHANLILTAGGSAPRAFQYAPTNQSWSDLGIIGSSSAIYGASITQTDGNAASVWSNNAGGPDLYANIFTSNTWGTESLIQANNDEPGLGVDLNGHYTTAFVETAGFSNILASRNTGSGWTTPITISSIVSAYGGTNDIKVVGGTETTASWLQLSGGNQHVFASTYADSWQTAVQVDTQTTAATLPQIGADDQGQTLLCWQQNDGSFSSAWVAIRANESWQTPMAIDEDNTANIGSLSFAYY